MKRQNEGPNALETVYKAIILHTLGVQVGFKVQGLGLGRRVAGLAGLVGLSVLSEYETS